MFVPPLFRLAALLTLRLAAAIGGNVRKRVTKAESQIAAKTCVAVPSLLPNKPPSIANFNGHVSTKRGLGRERVSLSPTITIRSSQYEEGRNKYQRRTRT